MSMESLATKLIDGDRNALARAMTLIESTRDDHRVRSHRLLEAIMPHTGGSYRIGISGVPGVGKSTFIDAFGMHIIDGGYRVAVLAVDPSSSESGGSILGDKTRMESLSRSDNAFIRPSPTRGTLGGVANKTRECLLLCEAAGFDVVLVETVGVGQSETSVANMTDLFLLLVLPVGGDELQGIKRGITELADLLVVNKADGDLVDKANTTALEYKNALRLLTRRVQDWNVPVCTVSAIYSEGIAEIWRLSQLFRQQQAENGEIEDRRGRQLKRWLWDAVIEEVFERLRYSPKSQDIIERLESEVVTGQRAMSNAAQELVKALINSDKEK